MKLKRFLQMFIIITIFIAAMSLVVAEDNVTLKDSNMVGESISVDDFATEELGKYLDEDIADVENGTFTELNDLFRMEDYVELDKDYAYTQDIDHKGYLDSGVNIGNDLIVYGNGHTIYGNGARMLYIFDESSIIKMHDLRFENIFSPEVIKHYTGEIFENGGAIYNLGNLYLYNCTFINNFAAENGGAIFCNDGYRGYSSLFLYNCTFINCSSDSKGGAIYSSHDIHIESCKFYNSSSYYGGAIYGGTESYISNSLFEGNAVQADGGAIYNSNGHVCDVCNSTFERNVARNGGAIVNSIVRECKFGDSNYAGGNGSDLYNCININCIFNSTNPKSCFNITNSTGFTFKPRSLIINQFNETLDIFVLANPNGEKIPGVALGIILEDEEKNIMNYRICSDKEGVASLSLSGFSNGTYKMIVFFENEDYDIGKMNYTLILGKLDSKVSFSANVVFEYNRVGSIYVKVEGGTLKRENIKVLNHPNANIDLNGEVVSISGLPVGSYTLSVETTPDDMHLPTVGTIGITVKKAVAVIKASKLTVALKKGTYWTIKLVDAKTNAPIPNMKLTLKVYTGSKFRTVSITTNSRGEAKYKTSTLSKGNHKVIVSGSHPDYSFNTVTSSIKVIKPKALKFKLHKRVNDKDGSLISYVVKDKKTKKGVNGIKIKLLIYTGKKVKTVTLKTKKKGKFNGAMGFATNELSVGKHKVVIVPASIKYSGSAKTTMIIKKAAKKKQSYSQKL